MLMEYSGGATRHRRNLLGGRRMTEPREIRSPDPKDDTCVRAPETEIIDAVMKVTGASKVVIDAAGHIQIWIGNECRDISKDEYEKVVFEHVLLKEDTPPGQRPTVVLPKSKR
jgi:hypothetical protein